MTWKKVNQSDAGTASKFGGNDLDKVSDALNGVDVSDPINFNVDINALKANTNTLGDILKSNGTKYVRLTKGTANQVLAVNSGGTDIAWTTLAAGTGDITAGANVGTGAGQIFKDKTGTTLNFKRLIAGTNVTVTNGTNDVTIDSTGGGGGGTIDGLSDVTITTPSTGQVVKYNGTIWTNQADDVGSGTWSASATETLTNKTIDNDLNTLKIPWPDMLVYKAGSTIKAKNMHTGAILGTTSTTDASVVIEAAVNNMPLKASGIGGTIAITAGTFPCLTTLDIDTDVAACNGIRLIGAGRRGATTLNFTPSSALTNGIRFHMHASGIEHCTILANANVTNLIRIDGNGQHGIINGCEISGPATPPATGQIGIFLDGTVPACYYWVIQNSEFWGFDKGILLGIIESNACFLNNLSFNACNIAIDCHSGMHTFSNIIHQGSTTVGDVTLALGDGTTGWASYSNFSNIVGELQKSGATTVLLRNQAHDNTIVGVSDTSAALAITNQSNRRNRLAPTTFANVATLTAGTSEYTYTNTNGWPEEVIVSGTGTSIIKFVRVQTGTTITTGLTSGSFLLESLDALKITWATTAPTLHRIGH
jgi:hypothetical protein